MITNPYFNPSWGSDQVSGFGDSGAEGEWGMQQGGDQWLSQQDYAQGLTGGLSAAAANSQPIGDFNIDQYAGFKGSGQGLMSSGPIGAIVGGAGAQFGQFRNIDKQLDALDTSVNGVTYDAYGRPVYSGQSIVNSQQNIGALDKGINKLNKTHLDPATNILSSIFGSRRKMKRKRAALQAGIQQAQQRYNDADSTYRAQFNSRQSYLDRNNDNSRLFNLYRFRS